MRMPARVHNLLRITAVAALVVAACSKKSNTADEAKAEAPAKEATSSTSGEALPASDPAPLAAPTGAGMGEMATAGIGGARGAGSADMAAAPGRAASTRARVSAKKAGSPRVAFEEEGGGAKGDKPTDVMKPEPSRPKQRPGQLTAGEWNDLDHWAFWRALFVDHEQTRSEWKPIEERWKFHTGSRIPVHVVASGKAVVDAKVSLLDGQGKALWKARTDNRGRAELFAGLFEPAKGPYRVVAEAAGKSVSRDDVEVDSKATPLDLELHEGLGLSNTVDIMFVVDTTGSMGDELEYLKAELRNVIGRVKDTKGQELRMRTSVNFYRDAGDDYKVRPFAFSESLESVLAQIGKQSAGGGGDFPEAVDAALQNAMFEHDWSARARARLLFLVLDAPPHEGSQVLDLVHKATAQAAELGIRIIPVSGSGIDKPTEFLMRFLAVATGGTYLFLTDDSGIGGSHLKPTIGPHEVLLLNELLTKVINRYVASPA